MQHEILGLFQKGGLIMWLFVIISVVAPTVVIERFVFILCER